jgi:hypothetical protein
MCCFNELSDLRAKKTSEVEKEQEEGKTVKPEQQQQPLSDSFGSTWIT